MSRNAVPSRCLLSRMFHVGVRRSVFIALVAGSAPPLLPGAGRARPFSGVLAVPE